MGTRRKIPETPTTETDEEQLEDIWIALDLRSQSRADMGYKVSINDKLFTESYTGANGSEGR